jgi:hypothetical protein
MLALVPLAQFREIATAMVVGILIDAFIVRSLLVPALVALFGGVGQWPGRHYRQAHRRQEQEAQPQPADLVAGPYQEPPAAQPGPAVPRHLGLERQGECGRDDGRAGHQPSRARGAAQGHERGRP